MRASDIFKSLRFVVNSEGQPESVIIDIEAWNMLMQLLDDLRANEIGEDGRQDEMF
jgi:PHD/YefM family antitoxin component YafN of YafNO toxin-antitoxin module